MAALLKAGADVNAKDESGNTPLHWVDEKYRTATPTIMEALLDAGANPTAKNEKGETPWDDIKDNRYLKGTDAYRRLKEAGASSRAEVEARGRSRLSPSPFDPRPNTKPP